MLVKQPTQRFNLWLVVYNEGTRPIAPELCDEVFGLLDLHFNLGYGIFASYGSASRTRIKDPRQWLHDHVRRLEVESRTIAGFTGNAAVWKPQDPDPSWVFEVDWSQRTAVEGEIPPDVLRSTPRFELQWRAAEVEFPRDPSLIVGIDLALARTPDAARAFAHDATALLLRRPEVWYGFINTAPLPYAGRESFYRGSNDTVQRWEYHVEQCYWHEHALATRDRVRSIYWGNIFGPRFAKKVVDAGYLKRAEQAAAMWPEAPITMTDPTTGSLAVFLCENPLQFARFRETRFPLGTMAGAVKTAAMLKDVLSRAAML